MAERTQGRQAMTPQPDCENCPFAQDGKPRHRVVLGEVCGRSTPAPAHIKYMAGGEVNRPIGVLVGEGPGDEEVTQGRPFVGTTGKQLDVALELAGINRGRMAVLNVMACKPPKGMKNEENLRAATAACRPLFMDQYEPYKQLPTLAMGKFASAGVNGGKPISIEKGRGFVRGNLLVTWHPTYAFWHNPWKAGEFLNDLARFKRMLTGQLERPPEVIIKPTMGNLARLTVAGRAFAKLLREVAGDVLPAFDEAYGCDIETRAPPGKPDWYGKDPTVADLKTIAFGTPDLGVAHWWGNGEPGIQRTLTGWLADPRVLIIGHNWHFFDGRVLARLGVKVTNVIDTRDLRRATSATSRLSLRHLVSITTDFAPWKETEDDK